MDTSARRTLALAAFAIAIVLFVMYFGRGFWEWATWNESKNTVDFGIVKFVDGRHGAGLTSTGEMVGTRGDAVGSEHQ